MDQRPAGARPVAVDQGTQDRAVLLGHLRHERGSQRRVVEVRQSLRQAAARFDVAFEVLLDEGGESHVERGKAIGVRVGR